MAAAIDDLTEPHPYYPLMGGMAEAGFWADMATVSELKCFALACYTRLPAKDQAAFLAHVKGQVISKADFSCRSEAFNAAAGKAERDGLPSLIKRVSV